MYIWRVSYVNGMDETFLADTIEEVTERARGLHKNADSSVWEIAGAIRIGKLTV